MKHPVLTFLCCCLWSASAWGELPVRMEQTPSAWAGQTTEWDAPHVGFANNSYMSIEKVTFGPRATQVHAVLSANAGSRFSLSSQSKLVWDGGESRIIKVSKLKLDKEHAMPDSGKLHIVMSFPSPPSVPDRLHFVESEEDGGWRLCNIHQNRPKASQPDGRTSSERSAGLPEHSRVVREERKATSPLSGRPITGSAWAPVAYTEDPRPALLPLLRRLHRRERQDTQLHATGGTRAEIHLRQGGRGPCRL